MTLDQLTSFLVSMALFAMMLTVGFDVSLKELAAVAGNWGRLQVNR